MCDLRPGDDVVCINDQVIDVDFGWYGTVKKDVVYRVTAVGHAHFGPAVWVAGAPNFCPVEERDVGYRASRFRKVQRRKTDLSIESFLTIKPGFEEPRRVTTPTRKRERA